LKEYPYLLGYCYLWIWPKSNGLTFIPDFDPENPRPGNLSAILGRFSYLKEQSGNATDSVPSFTGYASDLKIIEGFGYFWHSILHTIKCDIGWYQMKLIDTRKRLKLE
jgi:hypothetical protein